MKNMRNLSIIIFCAALGLLSTCAASAVAMAAERGQDVAADQLPEELRLLTVEKHFIPSAGAVVGQVGTIRGHLVVRHGSSSEAYFAASGDNLYEQDELFTLSASRCRVQFNTSDIVNMGEDSRIKVDEMVDDRLNGEKKSRLSMLRGKAMFYVMRLLKYNKVDTAVHTPTAVCGVRGTKFAVIVQKKASLWSGTPIYLADASDAPLPGLLADNGGGGTETVMIMVEGSGFMTAGGNTTNLGSGQTGTAGPTGPPTTGTATPGQIQGVNNDTNPDGGGTGDDGDGGDTGGGGDDTGGTGGTGDSGQDGSDTIANLTQQDIQNDQPTSPAGPTKKIGYFAVMLTYTAEGSVLDNVFNSDRLADHEGPTITGTAVQSTSEKIQFNGSPGTEPVLTQVDTLQSGSPSDLGPQHQVQATQVGMNAFLAWGYWTMSVPFYAGNYIIDNPGVYVHGDPTPVENLGGISGHYDGSAWGTYWSASGGVPLAGTMSADVNLGQTLSNLYVSASGGGNTVTIEQLYDTSLSGPNGEFMLNQSSYNVDCRINNSAVDYGTVTGGLFGQNGEAIGGTAAMRNFEVGEGAVVGFQGINNGPPKPGNPSPPMDVQ